MAIRCVSRVFALLALAGLCSALAETRTISVAGGDTIDVASSGSVIEVNVKPERGLANVETVSTTPPSYKLRYTAPQANSALQDRFKYTSAGAETTVEATVVPKDTYGQAFKWLFALFVLALLLESGLAVLFNWRPFIHYLDGRGVKTVISVLLAWAFVHLLNFDAVTTLVGLFTQTPVNAATVPGYFLTALILAGGSSGVNRLLLGLGFRGVTTPQQIGLKPPPTQAWIAVKLKRVNSVGPVQVFIDSAPHGSSIAGTIVGSKEPIPFVTRDFRRFPTAGGLSVAPNQDFTVKLEARDAAGNIVATKPPSWGPYKMMPGAMVDIQFEA